MHCRVWQKKLSCLVDGALGEGDRQSLEAHLASCAACRSARDRFLTIRKAFAGRPDALPPPHFYERMMARMADGPARTPAWKGWHSFGRLAVAALLLIAVVGLSAYWLGPEGEPAAHGILGRYLEEATGDDGHDIAVLYRSDISRDAVLKVAIQRK